MFMKRSPDALKCSVYIENPQLGRLSRVGYWGCFLDEVINACCYDR